ncbi:MULTISPECIES: hypothetical protein [Brachybacterium]|uniref:hypothetical protein n=1 Tax=Brachybacterium TaxID=43668 RepID=UPI0013DEE71E|nr:MULTISPECIES: hypothetical protein [Brachybacterium]MCT1436341.1 hypothetical protein [Brachybacterium paraconglomeratum]
MKNATIATSRTRATSDHLIAYRPLPRAWGDVDALHAVRERRALAAAQGLDPSTLELPALLATAPDSADGFAAASRRAPAHRAPRRGLWARLLGGDGTPRQVRGGGQHLAAA